MNSVVINRYARSEMLAIWSDEAMYKTWLDIELAVLQAYSDLGVIDPMVYQNISQRAAFSVSRIEEIEKETHHDILAFLQNLSETVNHPDSRFIHLGLTSSDIKDTGLNLQIKESAKIIDVQISKLLGVLEILAKEHKYLLCVGRSHGVHAEPITFGFKILNFYSDFRRSGLVLAKAFADLELCMISGAVGTYANVNPEIERRTASILGLQPTEITTQVIARDHHARLLNEIAVFGSLIERLAVEIRHLQRTEVLELEEPFYEKQKGSSAMPHKRNPWRSENLTGLARMLRAFAGAGLEDIALWHERDISHSSVERIALPDSLILLDFMLERLIRIMSDIRIYPENMKANLYKFGGIIFSQELMLKLVHKGLDRQVAYELIQSYAKQAWANGDFKQLVLDSSEIAKYLSPVEVEETFNTQKHLEHMDFIFEKVLT